MAAAPRRLRHSLRALGGRLGDQWERDRRDTLFLMAGPLLAALPNAAWLPLWVTAGFFVLWSWRLGLVLTGRALPPSWLRIVAAIAATAAVYAEHDTLFGREAGVSLLMLFLGLKLMEMRAKRDLFVVLFLCFFMLLTGFFQSQSMLVGALVLFAVLTLVAAMVTMQFGAREESIPRRFRTAGILLLQALPLAAAMFVLFPRMQQPLWGMPDEGESGRTGLSDSMTPGNISNLSNSDEVAFRVKFEGPPLPAAQMYWRGPVFGRFDGTTWRASSYPMGASSPEIHYARSSPAVRYALTLEPSFRRWLFALDAPVRVDKLDGKGLQVTPDLQLMAGEPVYSRLRYEVESRPEYALDRELPEHQRRNWVQLPPNHNRRTLELAARWASEEQDPEKLVKRALRMFGEQPFRYTMNPPLVSGDTVDGFLFDTRAGFCEHYAGAFAVLMRALDIPARIVTGYQGAEYNPVDDYWIVRQADAHAWAEVWLAGKGWVRIDPVTAVAPSRIERGARSLTRNAQSGEVDGLSEWTRGIRLNFDAFSHAWNQWVLSYDGARQQKLVSLLGLSVDDWRDMAGLLAVVLTVALGGAALFTLHPRLPRDPVERWYGEFCDRLAVVGLHRAPHETASRHLERVAFGLDDDRQREAWTIVSQYNNLRYGDGDRDPGAVQHFRASVRRFKP